MSEENKTTQTEATQVNPPSTEASQNNVSEGNIPQSRFNEVNTQKNEYKTNKRNSLMESLTEDTDKSIAESLPLDKLELYVGKITKRNNLPTNNSRASNNQPTGDFGGYNSIEEFASKDPAGADKYLTENVKGYTWGK